jgi:DNA-binding SARP family transcriptional activator
VFEFAILGPVEVRADGRPVPISAAKLRTLLAALLLRPNRTVPTTTLIEQVWGDQPPQRGVAALQNYVMRLRHALGGSLIRTTPGGYSISVAPAQLDLTRFSQLIAEAATAGPATRARLLTTALELWRGPALEGVPSPVLQRSEVPRLEELRFTAVEMRIDADLELGRHAALVPELRSLTAQHPLRERLWHQLMLSLRRSGRRAEALAAYRSVSELLSEELGLDPGPELREQFAAILQAS